MKAKIVYVGSLGFPFGTAAVNRRMQIISLLKKANIHAFVVVRRGFHAKEVTKRNNITIKGECGGGVYFHCSLVPYRPTSFLIRNASKFIGVINELFLLIILRINGYKHLLTDTLDIGTLRYYSILSQLLRMKLTYDYVEYVDSLRYKDEINIENLPEVFDKRMPDFVDQVIVIDDFLKKVVEEKNTTLEPYLLPPSLNFSKIEISEFDDIPKYIAYCGAAAYRRAIELIIEAYALSQYKSHDVRLLLIINGNELELAELNSLVISKKLEEWIEIKSALSYPDLLAYYKNSQALLLPLSENVQDRARFPFKLCEYTYSGKTIITNKIGVVQEYFQDKKNALFASVDDVFSYSECMNYVFSHPEKAKEIGKAARAVFDRKLSSENYSLKELFR